MEYAIIEHTLVKTRLLIDGCEHEIYHKIFRPGSELPACREVTKFFRQIDRTQKLGLNAVLALQETLKIKKANGKPIKPVKMEKVKPVKVEPVIIKTEIRRPVTMLSPSIKIEAGNIEIKYNKFPGWTKIKWFRANNWKWDNKRALHVKKYTYGNLKKLTETINN